MGDKAVLRLMRGPSGKRRWVRVMTGDPMSDEMRSIHEESMVQTGALTGGVAAASFLAPRGLRTAALGGVAGAVAGAAVGKLSGLEGRRAHMQSAGPRVFDVDEGRFVHGTIPRVPASMPLRALIGGATGTVAGMAVGGPTSLAMLPELVNSWRDIPTELPPTLRAGAIVGGAIGGALGTYGGVMESRRRAELADRARAEEDARKRDAALVVEPDEWGEFRRPTRAAIREFKARRRAARRS